MEYIGRYRVETEIGKGGMGVVFRAFDPTIGRKLAIKTIPLFSEVADRSAREFLSQRLLREAQAAGALSHPGIASALVIIDPALLGKTDPCCRRRAAVDGDGRVGYLFAIWVSGV